MTLRKISIFTALFSLLALSSAALFAQYNNSNNSAVGGVSIDASGILFNANPGMTQEFISARQAALQPIAADLQKSSPNRKISLKALDAAIAKYQSEGKPLPDEIQYMAGLKKIEFVFAFPDKNDIVLVGPAEPWKIGPNGAPVGKETGEPIMLLEDFVVALRTSLGEVRSPFACSIDPTQQGLNNLSKYASRIPANINPRVAANNIEKAMGNQSVRVEGIDATSHFARVMVSSDYQMKQISMGVRPASVDGLPPFTKMIKSGNSGASNALPRWWMAPNYASLLRDESGLSWNLKDGSVKTMCETDFLAENGQVKRGAGKTAAGVQKWADTMTSRFEDLSKAEPVFGQLRNCMDLAVVSALIAKENMLSRVANTFPALTQVETFAFNAPKEVPCMAAVSKARKVMVVCGGVEINHWAIVNKAEVKQDLSDMGKSIEFGETFYAD